MDHVANTGSNKIKFFIMLSHSSLKMLSLSLIPKRLQELAESTVDDCSGFRKRSPFSIINICNHVHFFTSISHTYISMCAPVALNFIQVQSPLSEKKNLKEWLLTADDNTANCCFSCCCDPPFFFIIIFIFSISFFSTQHAN
jgi:hypothetical protein